MKHTHKIFLNTNWKERKVNIFLRIHFVPLAPHIRVLAGHFINVIEMPECIL